MWSVTVVVRVHSDKRKEATSIADSVMKALEGRGADVVRVKASKIEADETDMVLVESPVIDAIELCELLAELVERNTGRKPKVLKGWVDAADRLLRIDERPLPEATRVLQWSQDDEFWCSNIMSMPKFRKQYDRLKLQMLRDDPQMSQAQGYMAEAIDDRRKELADEREQGTGSNAPRGLPAPKAE